MLLTSSVGMSTPAKNCVFAPLLGNSSVGCSAPKADILEDNILFALLHDR